MTVLSDLEQKIAEGREAERMLRAHWRREFGLPEPITFSVPYRAPPKANLHKVAKHGKRMSVVNDLTGVLAKQEESFAMRALEQLDDHELESLPWPPGPILASVTFVYAPTASWPQWKQEAALAGVFRMVKPPDLDNVTKFLLDALEGEVFVNDKYVFCYERLEKRYGPDERIEVTLERVPQATCETWKDLL